MTISLPVYQHPTSVVLVDDSASFIASVEYQISPNLAVKSFLDPHEALSWLGGQYHSDDGKLLPIRIGYDEQTFSFERRTIALDVDQIYRRAGGHPIYRRRENPPPRWRQLDFDRERFGKHRRLQYGFDDIGCIRPHAVKP